MDLTLTITQLKGMTRAYLESHGHTFNERGFCNCPNPSHTDNDPSCHFVPGTDILKCHGCLHAFDLFHLAEWFEGFPRFGHEFLTITMVELCKRFSIPYEPPQMSEEDLYKHKVFRAYKDATLTLLSYPLSKHIEGRGWSRETCESTMTGSVPDWDDFAGRMRKLGYSATYLKEIDITPLIFNEHTIVFTWTNIHGAPVGFSARDVRYEQDKDNPSRRSKYYNTGVKCPIFRKGQLLYGLHWAKGHSPVVITEGFPDVLTPYQHGVRNVICLGGIALGKDHVDLLRSARIDNVVLALNPDDAGNASVIRCLDNALSGESGVRVRVLDLKDKVPDHKDDIDNFFKYTTDPLEGWHALPMEDAFAWRLRHFPDDAESAKVVEEALGLVVNEGSNTRREDMVKVIATRTGYSIDAIQRDLDKRTYAEREQIKEEVGAISTSLLRKLRADRPPDQVIEELIEAGKTVEGIRERAVGTLHSSSETVGFLDTVCGRLLDPSIMQRGFMSGAPLFDSLFNGIPRSGRMIGVAGEPSAGKSLFLHQLVWWLLLGITEHEENKDILILLFTTDDSRQVVLPRLMSIACGLPTNGKILAPEECNERELKIWREARERLEYYIRYGYLDVRDASQGITMDYFEDWIRYAKAKNPDRQILAVLDNFHKLEGYGNDDRLKYKAISQRIHKLKTQLNVTFLCAMELIKTYGRDARPDDIAETKKILYDCDALIHVHSDWQEHFGNTGMAWVDQFGIKKPIVKIKIWKNKISSKMISIWYDMDPETSRLVERAQPPDMSYEQKKIAELAALQSRYHKS